MPRATIGVIGGSGLYRMEQMTEMEEVSVHTPFGDPSNVSGVSMAFLPRHGRGHRISPSEIPVRANIWALKSLGVEWVISVSAVGSLRADIAPRDLIIPDQLFDRTRSRVNSFFEQGIVVHCTFAEPFCPTLSKLLLDSAQGLPNVKVHKGANAQRILKEVAQKIPADRSHLNCDCANALATSIITDRAAIPAEAKEKYSLLIGKYMS